MFARTFPVAGGFHLASEAGRVFVFLVVVALFVCHGAFGYAHQLPPAGAQAAHVVHAAGGHHSSVPDRTSAEAHTGGAYFATLLALLFGASLLLGGGVPASGRLPAPVARRRFCWAGISHPPRGPTLTSLQAFRL